MPPPRVDPRAPSLAPSPASSLGPTVAPKPDRILMRMVVKLTRVRQFGGAEPGRTLMFTFEGGRRRAERARCSFIDKDRVPDFDGEEAWFEVEEVSAKPWSYWRAVRQTQPPDDA